MKDLAIALEDRPGALAEMGEALGRAGVSIEGGGVWNGAAHFLFADGAAARAALDGAGIRVVAYEDDASGTLVLDASGGGRFEQVTLRPAVTIADGDPERAAQLHHKAHEQCFIANSCSVPIRVEPRA